MISNAICINVVSLRHCLGVRGNREISLIEGILSHGSLRHSLVNHTVLIDLTLRELTLISALLMLYSELMIVQGKTIRREMGLEKKTSLLT